ncbi:hypothetical protein BH20ACT2_BH20ACT2_13660 [soil metagenome]
MFRIFATLLFSLALLFAFNGTALGQTDGSPDGSPDTPDGSPDGSPNGSPDTPGGPSTTVSTVLPGRPGGGIDAGSSLPRTGGTSPLVPLALAGGLSAVALAAWQVARVRPALD